MAKTNLPTALLGRTGTGFLLRLTNSHAGMSTNIVGTKSPHHLRENVQAAARGPLPASTYSEAKARLSAAS